MERNALFDQQLALGKKMQKNPTEAVTKEWMDMRDRSQAMCERIQALETVILGGQEFPLNEFIQGDVYSPPDVYTVDEFFHGVDYSAHLRSVRRFLNTVQ